MKQKGRVLAVVPSGNKSRPWAVKEGKHTRTFTTLVEAATYAKWEAGMLSRAVPRKRQLVLAHDRDKVMKILIDWHTDEVTGRAKAKDYAERLLASLLDPSTPVDDDDEYDADDLMPPESVQRRAVGELIAREACSGCWTVPIDCTEGCGAKICTCNISTHDCDTFKAGGEA